MFDLGLFCSGVGIERMSDGVDTTLRERLDGERERLCGRLTGDALEVDLEEDLDRL